MFDYGAIAPSAAGRERRQEEAFVLFAVGCRGAEIGRMNQVDEFFAGS